MTSVMLHFSHGCWASIKEFHGIFSGSYYMYSFCCMRKNMLKLSNIAFNKERKTVWSLLYFLTVRIVDIIINVCNIYDKVWPFVRVSIFSVWLMDVVVVGCMSFLLIIYYVFIWSWYVVTCWSHTFYAILLCHSSNASYLWYYCSESLP